MEIIWSDSSKYDLRNIAEYVADTFGQRTAIKVLEKLQAKVHGLLLFPESGILDRKYSTSEYTVHHLNIDPNVIYYMLYPDAIVVGVVVHQKMSPSRIDDILKRFLEHYQR